MSTTEREKETPRTDVVIKTTSAILGVKAEDLPISGLCAHARQLERELAEAREEVERQNVRMSILTSEYLSSQDRNSTECETLRSALATAEEQRDDALEENAVLCAALGILQGEAVKDQRPTHGSILIDRGSSRIRVSPIDDEIVRLEDALAQAEKERDEARAACVVKNEAINLLAEDCGYIYNEHESECCQCGNKAAKSYEIVHNEGCPQPLIDIALASNPGKALVKELQQLRGRVVELQGQYEAAWINRNRFCEHINIIGKEIVGPRINAFKGDCCAPDAVSRETKNLVERLEERVRALEGAVWTQDDPKKSGSYWMWQGDEDSPPIHVEVMWSGTSNRCFLPAGQWGWTRFQDMDELKGTWWMPLKMPQLPTEQAISAPPTSSLVPDPPSDIDPPTLGTILARENRELCNELTQEQREELTEKALEVIRETDVETQAGQKHLSVDFIASEVSAILDSNLKRNRQLLEFINRDTSSLREYLCGFISQVISRNPNMIPSEQKPQTVPMEADWICEIHPEKFWPHGNCPGPGMPVEARTKQLCHQRDKARQETREVKIQYEDAIRSLRGQLASSVPREIADGLGKALEDVIELTDDGRQHGGSGYRISRISMICNKAVTAYRAHLALEGRVE